MVLTEPEYDAYNLYPETIDNSYCGTNCDNERSKFTKSLYYGRTSYVDLSFDKNILSTNCDENCAFCLKEEESSCIICNFLYESLDNGRKKCLSEGKVPQIIGSTDEMTVIISEKSQKPSEIITNEITDISVSNQKTNIQTLKLDG
jgi:hypothetical protein